MNRSKKVVFVPFCLICQCVRAQTLVKKYPAIVSPVVQKLIDNDINIIQMPCPELIYQGNYGGLTREPCGKLQYDNEGYRKMLRYNLSPTIKLIQKLINNNYTILAVLGIENSPTCAVNWLFEKRRRIRGTGILIEEMEKIMKEKRIEVPFLGVDIYGMKKTIRGLSELIEKHKVN